MATADESKPVVNGQQAEIGTLRAYFKDNIRILSAIGQFSYILKIRADQYDVSLTLQLDESYPSKAPEIILTAPRLNPDQILVVQRLLQSYSDELLDQPMVLPIYTRLLQWFDENNIQSLNVSSAPPAPPRSPTSSKASASSIVDESETENLKKSSMKTAEDVISRIEWDERLDKQYFRVGYVDRFLGLQEKSFKEFDFKVDLSTVSDRHSSILAIPKHRIQYFKYNNEIIWDKETRTDLMFGSTGNQKTIDDIIQRTAPSIDPPSTTPDETTVDPTPRYLTLTDGAYKPNYYLSIPITDSTLIANYNAYRDQLLSSYPSFFTSRPSHLHLTLLTLHIESPSHIEQCTTLLKRLQEEIRYHCSYPDRLCLEFDGIDTFYDKVLFVKCRQNRRLEHLRTLIVERFSEQQQQQKSTGLYLAGNYCEFIPHMALLKCKRKFSTVGQNERRYAFFGQQTINSIQLSSIGRTEHADEPHPCVFKLDLS